MNPSVPPDALGREREALVIVHHHPGRIRVRADSFRNDTSALDLVREKLEALPGIINVAHNHRSGSMLIEYEPGHAEPDAILARIAEAAGLDRAIDEREARRRSSGPGLVAVEVVDELNSITHELTGWRADLRVLVPAALAGVAAYSFVAGKEARLPRWDNLLWWSYTFFANHHRREIERIEKARAASTAAPPPSSRTP
ncbi:MAG: HMA2 domain-containing protein [Polyangiaceae bacterium]